MSILTSPQRRQANRRNALRSTGPKSAAGKKRSAANALNHGLSAPIDVPSSDPLLMALSKCIVQEGHEPLAARRLASKILDYERNLAFQRELFVQQFALSSTNSGLETGARSIFAEELDMMDACLGDRRIFKRPIIKKDLNFVSHIKLKMHKLWSSEDAFEQMEMAKEARTSVRYIKRASNQLIKSLKAVKSA